MSIMNNITSGSSDGRASATPTCRRSRVRIPTRWTKFEWGHKLGDPKDPYLTRWMIELFGYSIRLHKWMGPDDLRHEHDHPWWYITWILKGSYFDRSLGESEFLKRWSLRYRRATRSHCVEPLELPTWTLMITGKPLREWGFWVNGKFRHRNKYFYEHGHH